MKPLQKVQTKTIRYGRLVTIEGFQNIRIELEDSFPTDKPDIECILSLQKRVLAMFTKSRMFEKDGRGGIDIPAIIDQEEKFGGPSI